MRSIKKEKDNLPTEHLIEQKSLPKVNLVRKIPVFASFLPQWCWMRLKIKVPFRNKMGFITNVHWHAWITGEWCKLAVNGTFTREHYRCIYKWCKKTQYCSLCKVRKKWFFDDTVSLDSLIFCFSLYRKHSAPIRGH